MSAPKMDDVTYGDSFGPTRITWAYELASTLEMGIRSGYFGPRGEQRAHELHELLLLERVNPSTRTPSGPVTR